MFAGRSNELEILIRALARRWCADDTPVTIVTGDDATQLSAPRDPNHNPLWTNQGNIQVFYSTFATPQTWEAYPDSISKPTSDAFGDCSHCFKRLFRDQLDDGHAIISYDSVVTAVQAARGVASPDNNFSPSADALPNGFYKITATNPVPGSSGLICYQGEDSELGHVPFNKAVPIMQLKPDGQTVIVALLSSRGAPASHACPPS